MANRRMLSNTIGTSRKIKAVLDADNQLGEFAALIYTWAITHTDDLGQFSADPHDWKYVVAPIIDRPLHDFDTAVKLLISTGLLVLSACGKVVKFENADKFQTLRSDRPQKNDYPNVIWQPLATIGNHWQPLATNNNQWQPMTDIGFPEEKLSEEKLSEEKKRVNTETVTVDHESVEQTNPNISLFHSNKTINNNINLQEDSCNDNQKLAAIEIQGNPNKTRKKTTSEDKVIPKIKFIFNNFGFPLNNSEADQKNIAKVLSKQVEMQLPAEEMLFQLESFWEKHKSQSGDNKYLEIKTKTHLFNRLLSWLNNAKPRAGCKKQRAP